ncbi:MAG: hypothetical protein F6J89_19320 [Symploca sp. SIO1C4]|uniref:Uncharacterized protein n=1 Tax=Symploca sp. SIO1C4 TaxID=2607765 RepID=A0A6B3NDM8_9CYAN|nr:hypothetical protein [Symploca sp. SIO1C4]
MPSLQKSIGLFFSLFFVILFTVSCNRPESLESENSSKEPATLPTPEPTPEALIIPEPETLSERVSEPSFDVDKIIQGTIDQLFTGKLLSNIPEEMKVNETERIEVRITKEISQDFTDNLQGRGKPVIEDIKFGTVTEVSLRGDKFQISPISSGPQLVGGTEYTQWNWDVTPLEAGEQILSLVVSVRIQIPSLGVNAAKNYPVEEKNIKVTINRGLSAQEFLKNNWLDLIAPIFGSSSLLGIIGWLITKGKGKKRQDTQKTKTNKDV